ncbi:MAG: hypothetical protein V1755_05640 [Chloroflexota bacterium]
MMTSADQSTLQALFDLETDSPAPSFAPVTASEVAAAMGQDMRGIAQRLAGLARAGLAERSCLGGAHDSICYRISDAGIAALADLDDGPGPIW